MLIRMSSNSMQWRGTFVYGELKAHERHHMWTLLRRIKNAANLPWLMVGDFNETMWQIEHMSSKNGQKGIWKVFVMCWQTVTYLTLVIEGRGGHTIINRATWIMFVQDWKEGSRHRSGLNTSEMHQ